MKVLLLNGAITNARDILGSQPIHWACYFNRPDIVTILARNNIDFNCMDNEGRTSLHVGFRYSEVLQILLQQNIEILPDVNKRTPLHFCLIENKIENFVSIVNTIEKIDINAADYKGRSYIHYAAMLNSTSLLDVLDSKKVNISLKDSLGQNVIHIAAKYGSLDFIKRIQQIERPHKFTSYLSGFDHRGRRPIHIAAANDQCSVIHYLIENRSLTRTPDKAGATPLHYACYFGKIEAIKLLLSKGNEIKSSDRKGCSVLHCAAASDSIQAYTILSESSNDSISTKDHDGRTPIFYASSKQMFDYLSIEFSADSKDTFGRSILHSAVELNYISLVDYFLTNKIFNVNISDQKNVTPLHLAAFYDNEEVLKILLHQQANPNDLDSDQQSALHYAAYSGSLSSVKILKDITNINQINSKGKTALNLACYNAHYEIILYLLGACEVDHNKRTPLHTFCLSPKLNQISDGQISIILSKLFLHFGVSDVDNEGRNPLHYAVGKKSIPCVKSLILFGAQVNQKDLLGITPLMIANYLNDENEMTEIIDALVEGKADPLLLDNKNINANDYLQLKLSQREEDEEEEEEEEEEVDDTIVQSSEEKQPTKDYLLAFSNRKNKPDTNSDENNNDNNNNHIDKNKNDKTNITTEVEKVDENENQKNDLFNKSISDEWVLLTDGEQKENNSSLINIHNTPDNKNNNKDSTIEITQEK